MASTLAACSTFQSAASRAKLPPDRVTTSVPSCARGVRRERSSAKQRSATAARHVESCHFG